MIRILCDNCAQELMKPGAILLSPPDGHECDKFHICVDCYEKLIRSLDIWKMPPTEAYQRYMNGEFDDGNN